ncbi:hypothetical protein KFE25_004888 [Diacronema lutheri]|uniref:BPL/LPL catalytic domain-containing protein n=1 Tax=Diacronema lutheri TaxID=2081491 RepID=A0A8J5XGB8_DIALT|nr:hypothetical protein KFE25_004888 [Diacronema lutheri]
MAPVRWIRLRNVPLVRQLRLEEALFRAPSGTWVVTNTFGSAGYDDAGEGERADGAERHVHAIAMGISGKPELLLDEALMRERRVPIVRRFTGGGTVVLDRGTLLVSLISGADALPAVRPFPHELMAWTAAELYAPLLAPILAPHARESFGLVEQDYCLGTRKCAGNAQAISGGRWVHHTSFLWDYSSEPMALLKVPARRPAYRGERSHEDFLVGLSTVLPSRRAFWERLEPALASAFGTRVEQSAVCVSATDGGRALAALEEDARTRAAEHLRVKTCLVDWPPAI